MGEANRKSTLSQRVRLAQPQCIYCGGMSASESADHAPPITLFDNRDRPRGLEFGACKRCHDGTRGIDLVASVFSRVYPASKDPVHLAEFTMLAGNFHRRFPLLSQELGSGIPVVLSGTPVGMALTVSGARMSRVMHAFAARIGMALHFATTRMIVPTKGTVMVRWYSNASAFAGQLPQDFLSILGADHTLQMGSKNVSDQFTYSWTAAEDRSIFGYFATFRHAFAVEVLIRPDDEQSYPVELDHIFKPGFLQGFSVE